METKIKYDSINYKDMIDNYIDKIERHRLEKSKKHIINRIKECEAQGNLNESLKLAQELIKIQKRIGEMQ